MCKVVERERKRPVAAFLAVEVAVFALSSVVEGEVLAFLVPVE